MTDDPIQLDEHRGMAAQKETVERRQQSDVMSARAEGRRRDAEFEAFLVAAPSTTWPEAAEKARYVIRLFAATLDSRDRRQTLIASALDDLARLGAK